ncbi:tripartite motif-containing protein [Anaeramoeba flamelloides]|uniref:Tripartite motif-containing protein n=1 Tax=Anaeramoeba flamelloides TaxID=1746091 RepID=A0AAV7Z591_9EUKA|nr:tripartite motif-containing protein [Anaeramoeba flamelloides]
MQDRGNKCTIHNENLKLYCQDEDKLICYLCYNKCYDENHTIQTLNQASKLLFDKITEITKSIENEERQDELNVLNALQKKNQFKQEISQISEQNDKYYQSLEKQIHQLRNSNCKLLKTAELIFEKKFDMIINKKKENDKRNFQNKLMIQNIYELKKTKGLDEIITLSRNLIRHIETGEDYEIEKRKKTGKTKKKSRMKKKKKTRMIRRKKERKRKGKGK